MKKQKKTLYEAQKNYLTCGLLMIIVGCCMFTVDKTTMGWGCIGLGALFVVIFAVMLKKMGFLLVDVEEKAPKAKDAETIEKTDTEKGEE